MTLKQFFLLLIKLTFPKDGVDMSAEEQLPHVFCALSPHGEVIDYDIRRNLRLAAVDDGSRENVEMGSRLDGRQLESRH